MDEITSTFRPSIVLNQLFMYEKPRGGDNKVRAEVDNNRIIILKGRVTTAESDR